VEGTNIRETAARTNYRKGSAGSPVKKEKAGIFFRGVGTSLIRSVKIAKDLFPVVCLVNHVVQCVYYIIRIYIDNYAGAEQPHMRFARSAHCGDIVHACIPKILQNFFQCVPPRN
jgi:hypothetical protein